MEERSIHLELWRQMVRIRRVEESIAQRYPRGEMRCPTHLCVGQEAVPAAAGLALKKTDLMVGTHRSHGHYLAKGGDLTAMLAEILGKATGCARGRGGSMHLVDLEAGFEGSTAIVGGSIPVGVGLALPMKLRQTGQVSVVFLGDGATEEGTFYESLNFAALKALPVVFLCENNLYSVHTPLEKRRPGNFNLTAMVRALGMDARSLDGNDAWAAYGAITVAVDQARRGRGPVFLQCDTYRWLEHCGPFPDSDLGYRSSAEVDAWRAKDPCKNMAAYLLERGWADKASLAGLEAEMDREIEAAWEQALAAPTPEEEMGRSGRFAPERRKPWHAD